MNHTLFSSVNLLFQRKAVLISSEIPGTQLFHPLSAPYKGSPLPLPRIYLLEQCNAEGGTHPHTHPRHFGVPPHSLPAAKPPSREGYKKPGQDGGQFPAAEVPVPTSQLLQEQLGICLGHGSGSVHLTAGQRREKVTSTIPAASAPLLPPYPPTAERACA